jgi:hypothetical protein
MAAGRGAHAPRDLSWMDGSILADLSDDGTTLLVLEVGVAQASRGGSAIYLRKTDGSPAVKLGEGSVSRLSPDGRFVLAAPGGEFAGELQLLPTGTGDAVKVPLGPVTLSGDPLFFPDGKRLLLRGHEGKSPDRLWALELPQGAPKPITPEGVGDTYLLSPDGKQLVASDAHGGLLLRTVAGDELRKLAVVQREEIAAGWSADGKSLFLVGQRHDGPPRIERLVLATGERQPWRTLFQPDPAGAGTILGAHVAPDGQSYAYNYDLSLNDLYLVDGVQ